MLEVAVTFTDQFQSVTAEKACTYSMSRIKGTLKKIGNLESLFGFTNLIYHISKSYKPVTRPSALEFLTFK